MHYYRWKHWIIEIKYTFLSLFTNMIFWNRHLKYFILGKFLGLERINSIYIISNGEIQLESRTAFWNGLYSKFEALLYSWRGA
jgi:hypothetical protein